MRRSSSSNNCVAGSDGLDGSAPGGRAARGSGAGPDARPSPADRRTCARSRRHLSRSAVRCPRRPEHPRRQPRHGSDRRANRRIPHRLPRMRGHVPRDAGLPGSHGTGRTAPHPNVNSTAFSGPAKERGLAARGLGSEDGDPMARYNVQWGDVALDASNGLSRRAAEKGRSGQCAVRESPEVARRLRRAHRSVDKHRRRESDDRVRAPRRIATGSGVAGVRRAARLFAPADPGAARTRLPNERRGAGRRGRPPSPSPNRETRFGAHRARSIAQLQPEVAPQPSQR